MSEIYTEAMHKRTFGDAAGEYFPQNVLEIAKRDGLSGEAAMAKAREEFPASFDLYQRGVHQKIEKAMAERAPKKPSLAEQEWWMRVAGIQQRDGVTKDIAMSRARKEYPDLFERYQAG